MLAIQVSPRRRKRINQRIQQALQDARPPYRRLAVLALDGPDGTHVQLVDLGVFLTRLHDAIEKEEVPEARAFMSGALETARTYYDRGLIPEWLTFAEGGVELSRIEPPAGTW